MTREEAIKILQGAIKKPNTKDGYFGQAIDMAIKALEQQTCDDAVSRSAVLDITWEEPGYTDVLNVLTEVRDKVKALPPVTPQPKTEWIPVSERLPKGSDIVLLSLPPHIDPDGEECSASVICGHYIGGKNKEWGLSDGNTYGYGIVSIRKGTNPIAWMPKPKPYKADGGEEE